MRKVMVFGVFDGVHEGHRDLFKQARNHGDYLIVVAAQNHIVECLKGRTPVKDLSKRLEELRGEDGVDEAVAGDAELGIWKIIESHRPDVIALGYDQELLKESLEKILWKLDWRPKIKIMKAHQPEKYHSNLIRKS